LHHFVLAEVTQPPRGPMVRSARWWEVAGAGIRVTIYDIELRITMDLK